MKNYRNAIKLAFDIISVILLAGALIFGNQFLIVAAIVIVAWRLTDKEYRSRF